MKKILSLSTIIMLLSTAFAFSAQKVEISGNDTMRFDKTSVEVKAGEEVELIFSNVGKLPKAAMGHNLVILKPGTQIPGFAMAAVNDKDNEYIPKEAEWAEKVVAKTKVLGPGEKDTIKFTLDAGTYPFICSFPGHFSIMQGTITAK